MRNECVSFNAPAYFFDISVRRAVFGYHAARFSRRVLGIFVSFVPWRALANRIRLFSPRNINKQLAVLARLSQRMAVD